MHEMNLQDKYFDYVKNGTKRVELRLYDEKRKNIKLEDKIVFTKGEDKTESLEAIVAGLLVCDSFEELFDNFDISDLADKEMTKEELLNELEVFYTKELQKENKVLGIMIKLS